MRAMYSSASRSDLVSQRFNGFAAAHRIGGIGNARFVGDDLLGAQRQAGGFLGGKRQRLVARVRVQALRPAQHRCHSLYGRAHDVDIGLLGGEGGAGSLDVEAEHAWSGVLGAEAIAHQVRVEPASGAELRDLLQEIVMRVEEK